MKNRTSIILADDHPIVLSGLRNVIEAHDEFELVGEASNGVSALALVRDRKPDVAVLDLSMPGLNGIAVAKRLSTELPSVRILLLTLHEDRAFVRQALDAGIQGYVLKRSAAECLVQAIRSVVLGGLYVDPTVAARIFKGAQKPGRVIDTPMGLSLTERETEVLKLIALGFTNKEIAGQLDVGVKSVETYKSRGTDKLGVKSRAELVRYAAAQGWLADI